jgi:hypothetical protein
MICLVGRVQDFSESMWANGKVRFKLAIPDGRVVWCSRTGLIDPKPDNDEEAAVSGYWIGPPEALLFWLVGYLAC